MASLQKWRQTEICAYELRFAAGSGGKTEEIRRLCSDSIHEFESALDDNMNTALALSVFMRFVNEINKYAANDELTNDMSLIASSEFNKFLDILGLKVAEPTEAEIMQIETLVKERNRLRQEQNFTDSDTIRQKLNDDFSVRLIDHRNRTIWMKIDDSLKWTK
jgi:cysteinyl-tRNA synthetase